MFKFKLDVVGPGVTIGDWASTVECPAASGLRSISDGGTSLITFEVSLGVMSSARRGSLDD